ncbi:MAG TPA: cation:dicarboxylase symporter family transporter [Telluria sp.]|nr:cation:dicarboxylase symporter family transporter [Telluria sp.]
MIARLCRSAPAQMLAAIGAALVLGLADPRLAVHARPLSDLFVRAIGLIMSPLIFCLLVSGIASMRGAGVLGRTGLRAVLYFLAMSVLSLLAGLLAATLLQPGVGFAAGAGGFVPAGLDADWLGPYGPAAAAKLPRLNNVYFMAAAIPAGLLLAQPGPRAEAGLAAIDKLGGKLFALVQLTLRFAPLAAFGAVASTIGSYGIVSLLPLLHFIVACNLASGAFVLLVTGGAAAFAGLSIVRFIAYVREEIVLVFFTCSSLAALPALSDKLTRMGCAPPVVALVLPFGYSLNLTGTTLYIVLSILFLAQAANVELSVAQLAEILAVTMIMSKSAAGVAGSGLATLTATLAILDVVPVEMVALLVGIDRTMKCRSITNFIGNGVACAVVAAWEQRLDRTQMASALGGDAG